MDYVKQAGAMFYDVSLSLAGTSFANVRAVEQLDTALATCYIKEGGVLDESIIHYRTGIEVPVLRQVLDEYANAGILRLCRKCVCGWEFAESIDELCPECGLNPMDNGLGTRLFKVVNAPDRKPTEGGKQPNDVFISYHSSDGPALANQIKQLLREFQVFMAPDSIPGGADGPQVYLREASRAKVFIAVWTPLYPTSTECLKEMAHALRRQRRILRIPTIDDVPMKDMPWIKDVHRYPSVLSRASLDQNAKNWILSQVHLSPAQNYVSDMRVDGCIYLLRQARDDLQRVINSVSYLRNIETNSLESESVIAKIIKSVGKDNSTIAQLCNALEP